MALRIGVDFDANDWACIYAAPADAPNLLGAVSVDTSALRRGVGGAGASASAGTAFARYGEERALYGKRPVDWVTGTTLSVNLNIGWDGATYDMASQPIGTYTAAVWLKLASGTPADRFILNLYGGPGVTLLAGSASVALNSTVWTKLTVTGTQASAGAMVMQLFRVSGTTSLTVQVAGAMITAGAAAPNFFNCGAASLLEPLNDYAMRAAWELGFKQPYQSVAPVGRAELTLTNDDKRYSPEYAGGPHFGSLRPGLLLQIGDPDYGIKWTGWTDKWKPLPGLNSARTCTLTATDARRFLDKPLALLPLQESTAETALVSNFLLPSLVALPNTTSGIPAGTDDVIDWDALTGETVPYYGDGNDEDGPASKVIADIAGAVQGKFWLNRFGQFRFTSGQGDDTPSSFVNLDDAWMTGAYEDAPVINESNVNIYLRKASGGAVTLWDMDETIVLASGESETIRVFFRNTTSDKIVVGARTAGLTAAHTASGISTTAVLLGIGAQSALVRFDNVSGSTRTILTCSVTGTRIVALRTISKTYEDAASKTANGLLTETLDYNWVQSRTWAKKLSKYRVSRFKDPRRVFKSVVVSGARQAQMAHRMNIGRAVQITDTQLGHDDYYAVIGERHRASDGLSDYKATFYVEPLYPTRVADISLP